MFVIVLEVGPCFYQFPHQFINPKEEVKVVEVILWLKSVMSNQLIQTKNVNTLSVVQRTTYLYLSLHFLILQA